MASNGGTDDDEKEHEFLFPTGDADERFIDIVEAVADVKGVDVRDLRPLSEAVDVEMLYELLEVLEPNEFYRSSSNEPASRSLFRFEYEGCVIEIEPDGFSIRES